MWNTHTYIKIDVDIKIAYYKHFLTWSPWITYKLDPCNVPFDLKLKIQILGCESDDRDTDRRTHPAKTISPVASLTQRYYDEAHIPCSFGASSVFLGGSLALEKSESSLSDQVPGSSSPPIERAEWADAVDRAETSGLWPGPDCESPAEHLELKLIDIPILPITFLSSGPYYCAEELLWCWNIWTETQSADMDGPELVES